MIRQASELEARGICRALSIYPSSQFKSIVLVQQGRLLAATGYDNWSPASVQMHIWIPERITKDFTRESFRYPFEMADRKLAIAVVPADNARSLRFCFKIGFKETYRIKDGWDTGVDYVVHEMRKEDCKWVSSRSLVRKSENILPKSITSPIPLTST